MGGSLEPGKRVAIKTKGTKGKLQCSQCPPASAHLHICSLAVLQNSRGNGMQQVPAGAEGDFGCRSRYRWKRFQ